MSLSESDRAFLLRLARDTLARALAGEEMSAPDPDPLPESLVRHRGVFVSIYRGTELRGCRGHIDAREPLHQAVTSQVVSSALDDPRFLPVRLEELHDLTLTVYVLTEPEPVPSHEHIVLERHGIVLEKGGRNAVFLPRFPLKMRWDLETTLTQLSLKAGLDAGAWRSGATFHVFEAEEIAEQ